MYCLRCGSETSNDKIFCEHCLEKMDEKPVKPGTPIKLPVRDTATAPKKVVRKKTVPVEEQIIRLKQAIKTWRAMFLATFLLMAIFAYLFISGMIG